MPVIMGICWSDSTRSNVPFSSASNASLPFPTLVTSNPARTRLKQITPESAVLSSHTRILGFCVVTALLSLPEPTLGRRPTCSVSAACRVRGRSNSLSAACWPNLCCHPNIHPNLQAELDLPVLRHFPGYASGLSAEDPFYSWLYVTAASLLVADPELQMNVPSSFEYCHDSVPLAVKGPAVATTFTEAF